MTPTKLNRAPLTKRISALAITAAAALSFALFAPNAEANHVALKPTKEYSLLAVALNEVAPGVTPETANASQLADAVTRAISNNPTLKPGLFAGEALKHAGSNAQDAGDEIGIALRNAADADLLAAIDAIKRAGKGKDLNVNLVPDFAIQFVSTQADAFALAKKVIASKPGAGAVIGGFASTLATFDQKEALLNSALVKSGGPGLTAAAQDITKFVVIEVDEDGGDTADFTRQVALANLPLAPKIGVGSVAGDPTNGGAIVDALLSETGLPQLKSGVAPLINGVGKVADIEEISKIAIAVGEQIGTPLGNSTAIKFSKANGVVKSLAKAIVAKATTGVPTANTDPNSYANKQDEIAEVAAYMVGQILNINTINGAGGGKPQVTIKNAGSKIFALVLSAVNATKGKKISAQDPNLYKQTAQDVAGSVAETLGSLKAGTALASVDDLFFDNIIAFLLKKASVIGGKANTTLVTAAINTAYDAEVDAQFEDGTLLGNALTSDYPETDFRPF